MNEESQDQKRDTAHAPTAGERNALKSAKNYLILISFSYNSLIGQLEYEQYSHEEAVYAADNCGADWNEQAVKKGENIYTILTIKGWGICLHIMKMEY